MATTSRKGKKRIVSNNGHVQVNLNDNRVLTYDGTNYRFISGDKNDGVTKIQISNDAINVLDLP